MSLPFLPRSLVTTTFAFEFGVGADKDDAASNLSVERKILRRREKCKEDEEEAEVEGGGERERERERERGESFPQKTLIKIIKQRRLKLNQL